MDGSQFARENAASQSDIDTLAGVQPEFGKVNRNIKGPLESAIKKRVGEKDWAQVIYCAGGGWYGVEPQHGYLVGGQWIPDFLWITSFWRHKKKLESFSFVMENVPDRTESNLREVSINALEKMTGLRLWHNVQASRFIKTRDSVSKDDWWKAGQPSS